MELKLNIYTDDFCTEIARVATAGEFKLSLGICEDVLDIINIDMWEGGLDALSDESMRELSIGIIRDAFPFFKKIIKRLFNLTDEEVRNTDLVDIAKVVVAIIKYSISQLRSSLGVNNAKN